MLKNISIKEVLNYPAEQAHFVPSSWYYDNTCTKESNKYFSYNTSTNTFSLVDYDTKAAEKFSLEGIIEASGNSSILASNMLLL